MKSVNSDREKLFPIEKKMLKIKNMYKKRKLFYLLSRAMTSADLNQDGYDDLVVGAPGYSQLGRIQTGRVYIVYGNQSGLPRGDLDLDQEADEILEGSKVRKQVKCWAFKMLSLCFRSVMSSPILLV